MNVLSLVSFNLFINNKVVSGMKVINPVAIYLHQIRFYML